MSEPFRTPNDYELFLYGIVEQFSYVQESTLVLVRVGANVAIVEGELRFENNIRLHVRELIRYIRLPLVLEEYSYEVWQDDTKLYWYDPQPHPDNPKLKKNHPHHKHIPPDIKHNRVPAPNISFQRENLSALIAEIQVLIQAQTKDE